VIPPWNKTPHKTTLKHGDLVRTMDDTGAFGMQVRVWVALYVTPEMIHGSIFASRPGIHLFKGYWYGKDPLNPRSYGKINSPHGVKIGKIRHHSQAVGIL